MPSGDPRDPDYEPPVQSGDAQRPCSDPLCIVCGHGDPNVYPWYLDAVDPEPEPEPEPEPDPEPLTVWVGDTGGHRYIAETQTGNGGTLMGTRYELEARYGTCRVDKLGGVLWNANGSDQARYSIWSSNGTRPLTKLAETAAFVVENGKREYPVTAPVELEPGEYWIVTHVDTTTTGIGSFNFAYADQAVYAPGNAFAGGTPSSWPGFFFAQQGARAHYARLTSLDTQRTLFTDPPAAPPTLVGGSLTGYELVFDDEFDYFDRSTWQGHLFHDAENLPNSSYVDLDEGVLHLDSNVEDGHPNVTIDTLGIRTFRRGYFECRMNWTHGTAAWPAFWMFSSDWAMGRGCGVNPAGEIDVMEAWGPSPFINDTTSINSWAGTIHSDSAGVCSTNVIGPPDGFNYHDESPTVLGGQWHTYGCLWEDDKVSWFLDNVFVGSVDIGPGTDYDTLDQDMHLILYSWPTSSGLGVPGTPPDETSPDTLDVLVDWVRVWQLEP